jgi:hypothetical protein
VIEAGGDVGGNEQAVAVVRDLRHTPQAIERLRSDLLSTSVAPTALGRAALVSLVALMTSLALPWRIRPGIGPASITAGEGFGAVGIMGILGAIVGLALVVNERKLADPPPWPLALIGAVFGGAVVRYSMLAADDGIEIYALGPTLAVASSLCLITIGGLAQRRPSSLAAAQTDLIPPATSTPDTVDLGVLERAVDALEADVRARTTTVGRRRHDGAWFAIVAGLALWLAGLLAGWAVTDRGPERASLSGFASVATLSCRVALLVAASAAATAFVTTSRRKLSCTATFAAVVAGIVLSWRARSAIGVTDPMGTIGIGSGSALTLLGGVLVAGGATRMIHSLRPTNREFGGAALVVAAALTLSFIAPVPGTAQLIEQNGVTTIGGGKAPLRPLTEVSDVSVSEIAVDGSAIYVIDRYGGFFAPIVGGRVGSPLSLPGWRGGFGSGRLGTFDHRLYGVDQSTVYSVALPGSEDFLADGTETTPLASNVLSAALGPDGALWFTDFNGALQLIRNPADDDSLPVPVDLGPDGDRFYELIGAGDGHVYAAVEQDDRIVEIAADGIIRTVIGGLGFEPVVRPIERCDADGAPHIRVRKSCGQCRRG